MSRPAKITIHLNALKHNLRRVREFAPAAFVIGMVKANAYGHGLVTIGRALSGADALGVAAIEEGIALRAAGVKSPIVLCEGLFSQEEVVQAEKHQFTLVVHHLPQVEMLANAKVEEPFSVWLKINTGMNRLGVLPEQVEDIYQRLSQIEAVKKPIGLMTHFAEADDMQSEATMKQMQLFERLTSHFAVPKSMANSAGIIGWPMSHADWVRPGLMLYGVSPLQQQTAAVHGLQPVMTLSSRVIAIIPVKKGGKVGYGGTWTASQDTRIGIVGMGYGDGYPQFAKNGTPVLVNGKRCALVGRVSMDMLTVDLQTQPEAQIGDLVVLWGEGLPVEEIAAGSATSPYEILTGVTARPLVSVVHS